jgi:hypothetical protein
MKLASANWAKIAGRDFGFSVNPNGAVDSPHTTKLANGSG